MRVGIRAALEQQFGHGELPGPGAMPERHGLRIEGFLDVLQAYPFVRVEAEVEEQGEHFGLVVQDGDSLRVGGWFDFTVSSFPAPGVRSLRQKRVQQLDEIRLSAQVEAVLTADTAAP